MLKDSAVLEISKLAVYVLIECGCSCDAVSARRKDWIVSEHFFEFVDEVEAHWHSLKIGLCAVF